MGITYVQMTVANPANLKREQRIRLLVDSGANLSVIPATILRRLGIRPTDEETFTLANGDEMVRQVGIAAFKYRRRTRGSDVMFGHPGDATLVGVLTLGSLGLTLDPLKRQLREMPMLLVTQQRQRED